MTLIDTGRWLVVANFRENSLARLREGQPAHVALRGLPGQLFPAHVSSIGWGVSQGQGVPSGQLPDVKMPTKLGPAGPAIPGATHARRSAMRCRCGSA